MFRLIDNIENILIVPSMTVRQTMAAMDAGAIGLALIVDGERRLIATVTDGDVRRALLDGMDLSDNVEKMLGRREGHRPITAPTSFGRNELLALLQHYKIRHIPLIDEDGRPTDVAMVESLAGPVAKHPRALIMAGGFGTRLGQLTTNTPKPLLPVRGKPMMTWVIEHLRAYGVTEIFVSVHYLAEQIRATYGDGSAIGVEITYVEEIEPLGTAGAVSLIPPSERPLIVLNADVMCEIDLTALVKFHEDQSAQLTLAVRRHHLTIPFGVVDCDGLMVRRVTEKPALPFLVNAGIYVLDPAACAAVPAQSRFDMPELVQMLLNSGEPISAFPISEEWLDVGRPEDYQSAQKAPPPARAKATRPASSV